MFTSKKNRSFRSRLAVEQFDARIVPAVLLTQVDLDGDGATDDIRIVGDAQKSTITVQDDGAGKVHISIDQNGNGATDPGDISQDYTFTNNSFVLDMQLKGGNDAVGYVFTNALNAGSRTFNWDLGAGNDVVFFQGGTTQAGSHINVNLYAGTGNDNIGIGWGKITDSFVSVQGNMGAGNDKYLLILGDVDYESSVNVKTDLGAGFNTHDIKITDVGFIAHADVDIAVVGGANKDVVTLNVSKGVGGGINAPSSHLNFVADLLGGNDSFDGTLDGGKFILDNNSQASFIVRGGAGNDLLKMERSGSGVLRVDSGAMCVIDMDGGAGNDTVATDFSGVDAWQLESALGSRLKIRLDGGAGNDTLSCLVTNDAITKGDFDIAIYGGLGNDTMTFATNNNGGTPTYGPSGKIVIDGGLGKDTFVSGNPAIASYVGLETVI